MRSPTWKSFRQAKRRCMDSKQPSYKYYGQRGIKFKFNSYKDILNEIGPRPVWGTLDRIDTNGDYEIGNIKWSTSKEQIQNRRNSVSNKQIDSIKKYQAKGWTCTMISAHLNIPYSTVAGYYYE